VRLGNSPIEFGRRSEMRNYKKDKKKLQVYLPGRGRSVVKIVDGGGILLQCIKERVTLAFSYGASTW